MKHLVLLGLIFFSFSLFAGAGVSYWDYNASIGSGFRMYGDDTAFSFYTAAELNVANTVVRPKYFFAKREGDDTHAINVELGYRIDLL